VRHLFDHRADAAGHVQRHAENDQNTDIFQAAIMIYALLLVNVGNYVSGAAAISTVLNLDLTTAAGAASL
jgi:hypothetical protein